jgi:hypothetical protein
MQHLDKPNSVAGDVRASHIYETEKGSSMTKQKRDLKTDRNTLRNEITLRTTRSAVINAVAKANAALDVHLECWNAPGFLAHLQEDLVPGVVVAYVSVQKELEYQLALAINDLCYLDQELAGEYGSVEIIERTEAEWDAREKASKQNASAV